MSLSHRSCSIVRFRFLPNTRGLRGSHLGEIRKVWTYVVRTEQAAAGGLGLLLEELHCMSGEARAQRFAELAYALSDCGSAREGGDLGDSLLNDMSSDIEQTVSRLSVWDLSEILSTESGSHIFLRIPADYEVAPVASSEPAVEYTTFWRERSDVALDRSCSIVRFRFLPNTRGLRGSHLGEIRKVWTYVVRTEQAAAGGLGLLLEELHCMSGEARAQRFAELAYALSDCGSAREGGDLGDSLLNDMSSDIEQTVSRLSVWDLSEILSTESGSHIFLRIPADYEVAPVASSESAVEYTTFWRERSDVALAPIMQYRTLQILAKHQGSARQSSWRDPEGVDIRRPYGTSSSRRSGAVAGRAALYEWRSSRSAIRRACVRVKRLRQRT